MLTVMANQVFISMPLTGFCGNFPIYVRKQRFNLISIKSPYMLITILYAPY